MKQVEFGHNSFESFPCNKCGWCCQRGPCPLGLYLGSEKKGACQFLEADESGDDTEQKHPTYSCGVIKNELNAVKKMAASELILSGKGCSHKFGPHPVSLIKTLIKEKGLRVSSQEWFFAKQETIKEFKKFIPQSVDPQSIKTALEEFILFCQQEEEKGKREKNQHMT